MPSEHWGTYRLQVESPSAKLSNVAGFDVPYCRPPSAPGRDLPQPGGVKAPTPVPPPTHG